MKGIVFVKFNEFIEETFGLAFWDQLLNEVAPPSGGAYTTVEYYDDDELFLLIGKVCEVKGLTAQQAQIAFGRWLFKELYAAAPPQAHQFKDVFTFLHGVQNVIHIEVKKLNPNVILPEFDFLDESEKTLTLRYRSPRNMCHFCEGLIYGLADFTEQAVSVNHNSCVHNGDNECVLHVEKQD